MAKVAKAVVGIALVYLSGGAATPFLAGLQSLGYSSFRVRAADGSEWSVE